MNRIFAQLVFGVVIATGAAGQQEGASAEFKRRASQWMVAPEAAKRKAAYRSWLQLGREALPEYRQALEAAERSHSKILGALALGRPLPNPYAAHQDLAKQLGEERARVMALIETDWNKDGAKIAMLRKEMEKMEKLWTRVNRLATADTKVFDSALEGAVSGLMEIAREMERFDNASETARMNEEALRRHVWNGQIEGSLLQPQRMSAETTRKAIAELAAVEKENAVAGRWASDPMKAFATILNRERCIMGMMPLRLEEKLHDATRGHSEDMARLGFFAHESPVEGKKTPWDRARLAGFQGNGTGENIFKGSASPEVAYNAWFGSDGHRFIMFGDGNRLGVGISGVHWTMMTGNKS